MWLHSETRALARSVSDISHFWNGSLYWRNRYLSFPCNRNHKLWLWLWSCFMIVTEIHFSISVNRFLHQWIFLVIWKTRFFCRTIGFGLMNRSVITKIHSWCTQQIGFWLSESFTNHSVLTEIHFCSNQWICVWVSECSGHDWDSLHSCPNKQCLNQ